MSRPAAMPTLVPKVVRGRRKAKRHLRVVPKPSAQTQPPLPEPGTSDETVTQNRLRDFYRLQNEYYELRARYVASYSRLSGLVLEGAEISNGHFHVATQPRSVRRPKYKQVVIDLKGEDYQKKVLEKTAPTVHYRIKVE